MKDYLLPRSRPEEQGVDPTRILAFIQSLEENKIEFHGFTLVRHGFVISEGYWKPYRQELPHMLFSLSKSFTSTAIGLAVSEGLLTIEDRVIDFFPNDLPLDLDEKYKGLCVKHLLCMGTGHKEDFVEEAWTHKNWARLFFEHPLTYEPGTHFLYNNFATYMLSAIISKVTGGTLYNYLKPRLFDPLGIENPTWETDPRGISIGFMGLNIKNEDIAKFGLMLLNKGVFNGQRVVPEEWIIEATSKKISNGDNPNSDWNLGYGYQFWMCRHNAFRGDGAFGQFCLVLPDQDAVMAINSGINDMQIVLNLIYEHLLPAMSDQPLQASMSYERLISKCRSLHYSPIVFISESSIEENINNRTYRLSKNRIGFKKMTFLFENSICTLIVESPRGKEIIKMAKGNWMEGTTTLNNDHLDRRRIVYRYVGSYSWEEGNELVIELRYIETPFRYILKCRFEGDEVHMILSINVSFDPNSDILMSGKF